MRVLIAVADAVLRRALEGLLREWGHETVAVSNGPAALRAFGGPQAPTLALVDWTLPRIDGPLLCRKLRDRPHTPYVYLIMLGLPGKEQEPLEAFEAGADDYLPSPLEQAALRLRMRTAEHILALQSNLTQSRQALEYKSTHDALTGVWNRGEVLGLLEREIARTRREGTPVSIIMADVDYFKQINDSLGHLAGDAALREISRRLASNIRPYDAIGRYGGEEFLLVLSGCSGSSAVGLAERLREVVATRPVLDEYPGRLTISLGVANWNGEYGDMQALIRAADAALYCAKRQGRNRVEIAWDEIGLPRRLREESAA